jgi:hypothetical protein
MKAYASFVAGPVYVLMFLCGMAIALGVDPWRLASAVMICLPVAGAVVLFVFALLWASRRTTSASARR